MKQLLLTSIMLFIMGCNFNGLNPFDKKVSAVKYQKRALIVGVRDYSGTQSDFAEGIEMDVEKMKKLFEKWDFEVTVLFNEESMNLEEHLNAYSKKLTKNDKFIFYYTGHGSHTKDVNGDEKDGNDETIILSNGKEDYYFLDDTLNGYMNMIKAPKLVLFDSCHSGSAFRGLNFSKDHPMSKSLPTQIQPKAFKSREFKVEERLLRDGDYIVLSASQDSESSLATDVGSLFTNALYDQLNNKDGLDITLGELNGRIKKNISDYCYASRLDAHHPIFSVSNSRLLESSLSDFLKP